LLISSNRLSLHNSSFEHLFTTVTYKSASEVTVLSNRLKLVAFSPEEVGVDHDWLVFVSISESTRHTIENWISIVPKIDIIFGKITSWVHHVDSEGFVLNVSTTCLKYIVLDISVYLSNVLIFNFVSSGARTTRALKTFSFVHVVDDSFVILHLDKTIPIKSEFGSTS
jgi:hypothetical protein